MFKEFKEFALKGNMIDLAVGIIIGTAFGAIVSSLVDDIFMPIIGIIIGGIDFSGIALTIGAASINVGLFINAVVKFLIIAVALFIVVKGINSLRREEPKPDDAPPAPTREEELLTEIRDAIRSRPAV